MTIRSGQRWPLLMACTLAVLVAACGPSDDPKKAGAAPAQSSTDSDAPPPKSFTANVTGDISRQLAVNGDDVEIGFLPGSSTTPMWFSVSGVDAHDDSSFRVTSGIVSPFAFTAGVDQKAGSASVEIVQGDKNESYSTARYAQFFDTDPKASNSVGHLTLTKVEKLKSGSDLLDRYHLVGDFSFNAAAVPDDLPADCSHEAAMATQDGERHPPFKAELCSARKVAVSAHFDVVQDFTKAR